MQDKDKNYVPGVHGTHRVTCSYVEELDLFLGGDELNPGGVTCSIKFKTYLKSQGGV